jgi:hypothetical protein
MKEWMKLITICLLTYLSISFVLYNRTAAAMLFICAVWLGWKDDKNA